VTDSTQPPAGLTRKLLIAVAVMDLVLLTATGLLDQWFVDGKDFDELPWTKWPLVLLSLGREQTLGAWWTAAVLATAGLLFLYAASRRFSPKVAFFGLLGLGLMVLSVDELSGFHERVFSDNADSTASAFAGPGPWMAPLLPVGIVGLLVVRRFRGAELRWEQVALWVGLACLSSVALQEAIETQLYLPGERPTWLLLVEEGSELLGALLVLWAGLVTALAARREPSGVHVPSWLVIQVLAIVSVLAAATGEQRYGEYTSDPQSGLVQWWLGSAAALVVAVAAMRAAHRSTDPHRAGALRVLGGGAAVLAIAYGIDAFTWLSLAGPGFDQGARVAVGVALAGAALWIARDWTLPALICVAAAALVVFGDGAAGPWEIGAWWLAAAALFEAASQRTRREDVPAPAYPEAPVVTNQAPVAAQPAAHGLGWPSETSAAAYPLL
jgi:hypothetical protein